MRLFWILGLALFGCSAGASEEPGLSAGGSGAGGRAPACFTNGESCADNENGCCDGATCVHTAANPAVCAAICSEDSECKTGCCAKIDDGAGSVCAPKQYCNVAPTCIEAGAACADDPNGCCDGSVCVGETAGSAMGTCAASCTDDSECATGCCIELANTPGRVCAPDEYCPAECIDVGQSCARRVEECCAGTACVANETGTKCAELCSENTDCESGCCALADNGMRVCSPAGHCF